MENKRKFDENELAEIAAEMDNKRKLDVENGSKDTVAAMAKKQKFEVEKEWEEIVKKKEAIIRNILREARELEQLEVMLATRIREKLKICIRGEDPNNIGKPIELSEAIPGRNSLLWGSVPAPLPTSLAEIRETMKNRVPDYIDDLDDLDHAFLRRRSELPRELLERVDRALWTKPPEALVFTAEKIFNAQLALDYFNSSYPDTEYVLAEMVAASRVCGGGLFFHINFIGQPSDRLSSARLFFAVTSKTYDKDGAHFELEVETCCILDMQDEEGSSSSSSPCAAPCKRDN